MFARIAQLSEAQRVPGHVETGLNPQTGGPTSCRAMEVGPTLGRGEHLGVNRALWLFWQETGRTADPGSAPTAGRKK
jgi:hypothetical protein